MEDLHRLEIRTLKNLKTRLEEASCRDRQEELRVCLAILETTDRKKERDLYQRRILVILKKFTHKKYLSQWTEELARVRTMVEDREGADEKGNRWDILKNGLRELERIAELRFNG